MTESELLERAISGEQQAYGELMDLHLPKIYALALRLTGNPEDAEDITQETFIKAFRALDRFRKDSSFSTWIYRIAWTTAVKAMKKKAHVEPIGNEELMEIEDSRATPLENAISEDQRSLIRGMVDQLPPKQKMVLMLRIYENKPFRQIAQVMKRSIGSVKSNYFHAVRALQSSFRKGGVI